MMVCRNFEFSRKEIFISLLGKVFDKKDLQGLCGINNGTKKKDLDKTGYKGLGILKLFLANQNYVRDLLQWRIYFDLMLHIRSHGIMNGELTNQQTWEKENDRSFPLSVAN